VAGTAVEDGKAIAREISLPNRQSGRVCYGRCFSTQFIPLVFRWRERFGYDMTEGRFRKKPADTI
jgi:hypothetical protein